MNKIAIIGSIASILSLMLFFIPHKATSDSYHQRSIGNQSPNIISNGDVNIQYHNEQIINNEQKEGYYLSRSGKGVGLLEEPSFKNPKLICLVESGARVEILDELQEGYLSLIKVRVLEGTCKGKIGWTGKENLHKY